MICVPFSLDFACDDDQVRLIQTLLPALYDALQAAIHDADTSHSHPSAAYSVFFKDTKNAQFVSNLLRDITLGTAKWAPSANSNGSPTFICPGPGQLVLYDDDGTRKDAYQYCRDSDPPHAGTYVFPSSWILLCPTFFQQPAFPDNGDSCPSISRVRNRFARKMEDLDFAGSSIVHNQMWILFHELVHYYLFAEPDYKLLQPEVYNINGAWRLNPADSIRNSQNFVYYAVTVNAKCTDWPDYAHENDRELLEDDSVPDLAENQTVSDAAEGSVIRANATVHIDREGSVNFRRRVQ
ncbi:MAG: hypothetical protein LQ350_000018 [Teloschistes chrysophthalmus]|nr:MAG: hypothetical protein LQ350_000018 [Niorma chrysophthalma]